MAIKLNIFKLYHDQGNSLCDFASCYFNASYNFTQRVIAAPYHAGAHGCAAVNLVISRMRVSQYCVIVRPICAMIPWER